MNASTKYPPIFDKVIVETFYQRLFESDSQKSERKVLQCLWKLPHNNNSIHHVENVLRRGSSFYGYVDYVDVYNIIIIIVGLFAK